VKKAMMMIAIAIAALGATACGGKKEEPKPTAASGSAPMAGSDTAGSAAMAGSGAAGSAGATAGSGEAAAEVEVPTEVDFEGEAAAKIDEKNVEARLKAVEQELAR
jgi:hypothetical protein